MTAGYVVIDPRWQARVPWANGRGMTRELVHDPYPARAWRLSVADLEADAPFSVLPGLDRLFILLSGELTLTIGGREETLVAGEATQFRGEDDVFAAVKEPARAVNLMVRRDTVRIGFHRQRAARLIAAPTASGEFVILLSPSRCRDGTTLSAGTAIITDERSRAPSRHLTFTKAVGVYRVSAHRLSAEP